MFEEVVKGEVQVEIVKKVWLCFRKVLTEEMNSHN